MQPEHNSQQQITNKLQYIIRQPIPTSIPALYHCIFSQIKQQYQHIIKSSQLEVTLPITECIRINTVYSLMRPAYQSLIWQVPQQNVKYPVALVPFYASNIDTIKQISKNKQTQRQKYLINLKFATWVQSGGIRCIGLKSNAQQPQIQKFIHNSNCAVFPSPQDTPNNTFKQFLHKFLSILQKLRNQAKDKNDFFYYPVLFIGAAAAEVLQSNEFSIQIKDNQISQPAEFFALYQQKLFQALDSGLRLVIENYKKISIPIYKFSESAEQLQKKGYKATSYMKSSQKQGNFNIPCTLQPQFQKQGEKNTRLLYFIMCNPYASQVPQSIQLWHAVISNFVNLSKKHDKNLDQKWIQKQLIAHAKVWHDSKGNGFYQTH